MALKNLSNGAMISIGEQFNKPEKQALMQKDQSILSYHPRVDRDSTGLKLLQRDDGVISVQLGALTVQAGGLDADGDLWIGVVDDGCKLALLVCSDAGSKQALARAHGKVMAAGRRALVLESYSGVSGEAKKVEEALDADDWAALEAAKLGDTDIAAILRRWFDAAHKLTAVDQQRADLQVKVDGSRVSDGDLSRARNQWIRTMNAFTAIIRSSDLSTTEQEELLAALIKAERDADLAAAQRRSEA